METYTKARPLVPNPNYDSDRRKALEGLRSELSKGSIDEPTLDVLERFAHLPHCFTLQSCFGHFMREFSVEDTNTRRVSEIGPPSATLHYRIAYVAFCVEDSIDGRELLGQMKAIAEVSPDHIQFGSADWFWNTCVNSYVLQVSPVGNACQDHFDVSMEEALRIEHVRDVFFDQLRKVLSLNAGRVGR